MLDRKAREAAEQAEKNAALHRAREEAANRPWVELPPFGRLRLVDEVDLSQAQVGHLFRQGPGSTSRVETVLDRPCRVLAPQADRAGYFAVRLGRYKLLRPGAAYVLAVEYPEDRPRSFIVTCGGCETSRGFHTGATVGDALHPKYVNNNPESLRVPLSRKWEAWTLYFHLHDVTGAYSFDITKFQAMHAPFDLQWWVFLAFFLGFSIKVPMFPFHTWLPDAHTDAPTAGSVILAAVLLKMGTYGFIRFSLPILPEATKASIWWVAGLAIIGIIYGALVALAQKDWKRLVAYSSVSHMGMVMLGLITLNPVGITGSIIQQLNHGISTGALFLIVGIVYERRHTREIAEYGGLSKVMPVFAAIFMVMMLSSLGLPTLNGFIGEILILQGAYTANIWWAAVAASGLVLGAAYLLWLYQRTMFGRLENPKNEHLRDLSLREIVTFAPLVVLAVWIGIYPAPFINRTAPTVQAVMQRVNPEYARASAAAGARQAPKIADCDENEPLTPFTTAPCGDAAEGQAPPPPAAPEGGGAPQANPAGGRH
ncbi:MAG TPA: NADH-quinone oxidoreductase subunit M [Vicinamibacterales bacterium]|mgnify:CR=1 FL=1|nr:NADH-quinone oxidoreductase subunit M [Vicinamibacterales bacterium]